MPHNSNFRLTSGHRFFAKNGSYGYGAKSRWRHPTVHLGAKKWVKTVKKLPCLKIRIFDYPAVNNFSQKMEVTVMAPNYGGYPLGSIIGPMGSHWVKKRVKAIKKYHAPNFEFSTTPQSSIFHKKWKLRLWRQITVGTPKVHLGVNGVPLGPKNGSKPLKNTMPQNSNFRLPRVHWFFTKNGSSGYGAKSRWGPPGSILGPMGSHWVQKMTQSHKKLRCPKFRIFHYPAVIEFSQKMEVTVMAPNHGGDPPGLSWGQWGPIVSKKWLKAIKNYDAPNFEFSTTPRSSIFHKKWKFRLWRQITVGTP